MKIEVLDKNGGSLVPPRLSLAGLPGSLHEGPVHGDRLQVYILSKMEIFWGQDSIV